MLHPLVVCEECFVLEAGATEIANARFLLKLIECKSQSGPSPNNETHLLHSLVSVSIADMMFHIVFLRVPFVAMLAALLVMARLHVLQSVFLRLVNVAAERAGIFGMTAGIN